MTVAISTVREHASEIRNHAGLPTADWALYASEIRDRLPVLPSSRLRIESVAGTMD